MLKYRARWSGWGAQPQQEDVVPKILEGGKWDPAVDRETDVHIELVKHVPGIVNLSEVYKGWLATRGRQKTR